MAYQSFGRLNKLAHAFGTLRIDDQRRIAEWYAAFQELERGGLHEPGNTDRWPPGTADAILRALLADTSHTFTMYDAQGNRTVLSVAPFYRDPRGRIRWGWPTAFRMARLDYQESFAGGIPHYRGSCQLPDGTRWASGGKRPKPSPRALREMVVDRARRANELETLDAAVRATAGGWYAWLVAGPSVVEE